MSEFVVQDELNKEFLKEHSNISSLAQTLIRKAQSRGFSINSDDAVDEIRDAIYAVNERRRFTPTDKQLYETKYDGLILRMALCAIAKYGAEGQTSHSENGISRSYDGGSTYPKALLQEIVPLAKGVWFYEQLKKE